MNWSGWNEVELFIETALMLLNIFRQLSFGCTSSIFYLRFLVLRVNRLDIIICIQMIEISSIKRVNLNIKYIFKLSLLGKLQSNSFEEITTHALRIILLQTWTKGICSHSCRNKKNSRTTVEVSYILKANTSISYNNI